MPITWLQIINTGLNVALLLVAIQVTRHMTRLEFKVDLMWTAFSRKYGTEMLEGKNN